MPKLKKFRIKWLNKNLKTNYSYTWARSKRKAKKKFKDVHVKNLYEIIECEKVSKGGLYGNSDY